VLLCLRLLVQHEVLHLSASPHPPHNAPAAAFNRNKRTRITVSLRCLQPPRRFFFMGHCNLNATPHPSPT